MCSSDLALRSDLPIYAFEPNPFAFARLRVHVQVNRFDNVVEKPIALGHKDNTVIDVSWRSRPNEPISSGTVIGRYPDQPVVTLVRTVGSHVDYYERWAKSWEFQALLKARPSAGDRALGEEYVAAVQPFVWRAAGHPDFITDAQSMRRRVEIGRAHV